ncbi:hypothetical protein BEN44_10385 [Leptospira interrogans serovar Ricardi]|nr:hypothetical protein [Leptospira interrogans serovar Ricardi]
MADLGLCGVVRSHVVLIHAILAIFQIGILAIVFLNTSFFSGNQYRLTRFREDIGVRTCKMKNKKRNFLTKDFPPVYPVL